MNRSVLPDRDIPTLRPAGFALAGAAAMLAVIWTAADIKSVAAGEYGITAQPGFATINNEIAKNDDNDTEKITGKKKKKKKRKKNRTRRGSFS